MTGRVDRAPLSFNMQAVIMAAGRGTRLGEITSGRPKSLVKVGPRPILEHTLLSVLPLAKRAVIVIGYRGRQIKEYFGGNFQGLPLIYVEQKELSGTAMALWQARPFLGPGKFLVLNGDDFYHSQDLAACLRADLAMGLAKRLPLGKNYKVVELDKQGWVVDWHQVAPEEMSRETLVVNGAYVLDHRIFSYKPVAIGGSEFGLPHTILAMSRERKVKGVIMKQWLPINYPEDIAKAAEMLES